VSDLTFNQLMGTAHLLDCAESWHDLWLDRSIPWGVRLEALAFACAIWQELDLKPRHR
jgi:hypothetical protein